MCTAPRGYPPNAAAQEGVTATGHGGRSWAREKSYNETMGYKAIQGAPSPAEIARIKAALAAGVPLKDVARRFHRAPVIIRKLLANESRKA
jgi:hypothetical protein